MGQPGSCQAPSASPARLPAQQQGWQRQRRPWAATITLWAPCWRRRHLCRYGSCTAALVRSRVCSAPLCWNPTFVSCPRQGHPSVPYLTVAWVPGRQRRGRASGVRAARARPPAGGFGVVPSGPAEAGIFGWLAAAHSWPRLAPPGPPLLPGRRGLHHRPQQRPA